MTVIIVCGGRDFTDRQAVNAALDRVREKHGRPLTVITGGARGADSLAAAWARSWQGVRSIVMPAAWAEHGRSAGPKRNLLMLDELIRMGKADGCCIGVVAFPGGVGTAHMVRAAAAAGVPVWQPLPKLATTV